MRIDYRIYREPVFIWTCLGVVALCLIAVLFSPPVNNARRWFSVGGLGIQPSELAKLARDLLHRRRCSNGACTGSMRSATACCRSAVVIGALVGLILIEPDFGTSMIAGADRRGHGVRGRPQLHATSSARSCSACPLIAVRRDGRRLPAPPAAHVSQPLGRSARRRLSDHPVAHRRRHRRHHRHAA